MVTMYTKADLESKKKSGLQKIFKSLGLKLRSGLLKTELIELILEHQSEAHPSTPPASDSESDHEDLLASAALDVASAIKADGAAAVVDSENSNTSILDLDNMLSEDQLDSDLSLSKKHSRSQENAEKEMVPAVEPSPQPRLKRSNTFQCESPAAAATTSVPAQSSPARAKGRAKRQRSESPESERPGSLAVKRTRKSRVPAAASATLPRRDRRRTVVVDTDAMPRRHSRGPSPKASRAQRPTTARTPPAVEDKSPLRSNASKVLQKTPSSNKHVSDETITKRTILTPKRTLKTPSRVSIIAKPIKCDSNPSTPVSTLTKVAQQPKVSSPAPVTSIAPPTSDITKSPPSTPAPAVAAVEAPVSSKRLSRAVLVTKAASAVPACEALPAAVASPRLSVVSAQGRRLSSAKRLSSGSPLKRVVPTLAQPVFTIGKHDKKEAEKDVSQPGGKAKSSIPRFMVHAQKINKMPNFKRIHEKAFNSMQNLDEFVSKKKTLTNSVQKAAKPAVTFEPSVVSTKQMKLNFSDKSPALKFSGNSSPIVKFGAASSTTARPQTPRLSLANKSVARRSLAATATPKQTYTFKALDGVNSSKKTRPSAAFASSLKENVVPSPRLSLATMSRITQRPTATKTMPSVTKIKSAQTPSSPKPVTSLMQHRAVFKARAEVHGSIKSNVSVVDGGAADARPAVTKLPQYKPYKGPLRSPGNNRAALKHLASKKPTIATREERRDRNKQYIKGVRTNKRFQLQMERRGVTS